LNFHSWGEREGVLWFEDAAIVNGGDGLHLGAPSGGEVFQ
jgi:hypothetical protein